MLLLCCAGAANGAPGGQRYLVFGVWKWDASDDLASRFAPLVDRAQAAGFNAVRVHVPWYIVEAARGRYTNLELFDARLDYVIRTVGLKAIVSLDLTRRGADDVVPAEALQQEATGAPARGVNDRCMVSFASESAVDAAAQFVRLIVERYHGRYGANAVLAYSVTYSLYCESEYWVGGRLLDYSPAARQGFRAWVARQYGTVVAANAAWGTAYASLDAVEPPPHFGGAAGLSWYQFRHAMLKRMNDRMAQAIHGVAPGLEAGQQYGSVWDAQAAARGTIAFPDLAEHADLVCVDDAPDYPFAWSMDLLRGSLPGTQMANECDRPAMGSDARYLEQARVSFAHGATCVFFANWDDDPGQLAAHDATLFGPIRSLLPEPVTAPAAEQRLAVSAMELLRLGAGPAQVRYRSLSAGGTGCVDVVLEDDLSAPGGLDAGTAIDARDERAATPDDGGQGSTTGPGAAPPRLTSIYPNPANGQVTLVCELPRTATVDLSVYALNGQRVRRLVQGRCPEGLGQVSWDGCDDRGAPVASGVYLCRLRTDKGIAAARVALVR